MKKVRTLLKAPLLTQSGYGVHSRQIFRALISDPMFDVHVESLRWGNCAYLTEDTPEKRAIKACMRKQTIATQQGQNQYDLFIHVTIPNEWEQLGRINIGVTAGIETNKCSHVWVQKCNEMDLVIVPSEHSKNVFMTSIVEWENQKTGERGTLKVEKPVVICPEGVDTSVYKKLTELPKNAVADLDFGCDFNFLLVGQWGKGGFGEDRKNISNTVKYFIEEFLGRQDVGLVLKVNMSRNNKADFEAVQARLKAIKSAYVEGGVPPIHLLHATLSHEEMVTMYNHPQIKALVSFTHGEGFGLPLVEAAACGLPIIATNWSGHLDFLRQGLFSAVDYRLTAIPEIAVWDPILIEGSEWASVKETDAKRRLRKMVTTQTKSKVLAKELSEYIVEDFDINVVCAQFLDTVKQAILTGQQQGQALDPVDTLRSVIDTPDDYNILYTMPMSHGDVFISTAVIDGLMKEVPEGAKLYFATQDKYFSILEGNKHVHKVISWQEFMLNMDLTEEVFDLVLTPNTATQYTFSNWVRRGQGRLLAEEFANHCHTELGDYWIKTEDFTSHALPVKYMTFHPGPGKGQWAARNYRDWPEAILNMRKQFPDLSIVQVGAEDEPEFDVDVDLRGKTNIHQLATVLQGSQMHLSIDTLTMHMAAAFDVPLVAIFGCSHATSTGPWVKDKEKARFVLIESERKTCGCQKACYKNEPKHGNAYGPINEIDPKIIVSSSTELLRQQGFEYKEAEHERITSKIAGYTTTYNLKGYPFVESIKSMLGFCDEVVVLDGCSDDGTYEILEKLVEEDDRIRLFQNPWDFEEPGIDGMQKAFARAMCSGDCEFLWQQDCDEVVHEDDYSKVKLLTKRFPLEADILHLPVVELWGDDKHATGRRHSWKWRMSRNNVEITHGINKHARLTDEKTGKVYAQEGMSDGCEYVNTMTFEPLPHTGFYLANREIEITRLTQPEAYGEIMNQVIDNLPSVYHYSWCSLEGKIKNFTTKWDKQWNELYQTENVERFPGVKTDEEIKALAEKLYEQGGEDDDQIKYKFELDQSGPAIMEDWVKKNT